MSGGRPARGSVFQSTLSVRRATRQDPGDHLEHQISIHALREESDFVHLRFRRVHVLFQSTLSVRRATQLAGGAGHVEGISIHALREESDHCRQRVHARVFISIHALREESDSDRRTRHPVHSHFNPRSP